MHIGAQIAWLELLGIAVHAVFTSKPENSLLGFMNVLKSGIEIIELDIVFSKDGIPIITHDQDISPFFCRDSKGEFIKDKKKFQLLTPKNFTHMILVGLILKQNMESIFQSKSS